MLDEELFFAKNGKLTPEKLAHLQRHSEAIKQQLAKLVPHQPLNWISLMVRFGVAFIIYIILVIPGYTYVRNQYLVPQVATSTSASGIAIESSYIAPSTAGIETRLWKRGEQYGEIALASSTSIGGKTVGIIPNAYEIESGKLPGLTIFYTEQKDKKNILRKFDTDEFFRSSRTTSSTVWDDQDFINAVAVTSGTKSLLAAAYKMTDDVFVALQTYDDQGNVIKQRTTLPLNNGKESPESLYVTPWQDGWAVTTRIPRTANMSLFEPSLILIRFLDSDLRVTTTTKLELSGYEIGSTPQLVPNRRGNTGYTIIAHSRPLVRTDRYVRGDEIYALTFDEKGQHKAMKKLTNNGIEHDYGTTGFAIGPRDVYILGVLNIPTPKIESEENPYPFESGRAFLRLYNESFDIAGNVIVFDERASKKQSDNRGVANIRLLYVGNRVYLVYDLLNGDNSAVNAPTRSIMANWIKLKQ